MILIGYDGSPDARTAIEHVATLMPGADATVLAVWKSLDSSLNYHGGLAGRASYHGPLGHHPHDDAADWDRELEEAAAERAAEGAQLATEAGLRATPRVTRAAASTADAILVAAEELDASAIVVGSRGLNGGRSWFLGSVSHAALQHADRPVIAVPSAEVAAKRTTARHEAMTEQAT